jgi:WD40 repeat protein
VNTSRIELRVPGVGGRLDWSPAGTVFATEGPEASGIVDIRDARTGVSLRSFSGHDGDVTDVAFNHDGTLLATTGTDGAAHIWDPATGTRLLSVRAPANGGLGVLGPSFSPDGALFAASWPEDGVVKVVDLATGEVVRELRPVAMPSETTFDPTGTRIAVSTLRAPTAAVVDVQSGADLTTLEGHVLYPIMDIAWSPNGDSIATAGFDGSARVFDARTGRQRFAILGTGGHVYSIDWSPDSTRLVSGKSDGTARVWQLSEGGARELITLSAHDTRKGITGVAFSPDGGRVLTGDAGTDAALVWDVSIAGNAEVANLPALTITANAVDFTSDGRQLLASSADGTVTVWDAQTFTPVRTLGRPSTSAPVVGQAPVNAAPQASGVEVFALEVSPDDRLVAAARFDGSVRVWDMETGRDAFTVDPGPAMAPYMSLAWSPDGEVLAVIANDGTTGRATVIDRAGHRLAVWQQRFGTGISTPTFTPDGEQLVTSRVRVIPRDLEGGDVVAWAWRTGDVRSVIDISAGRATPSPTGHLIATTTPQLGFFGFGETVDVWDPATAQLVSTLAGNTGGVLDLAFNADGSRLAIGSQDSTVRVWDPASGDLVLTLRGHYASAFSVAFSPDGSRLASAGSDGVVRVWALELDELVEIAEREVTRTLTDEECQQYLHRHCE